MKMAASPLTPKKRIVEKAASSPLRNMSSDQPLNTFKSKLIADNEPSPASTYGETLSSSVPATPLDTNRLDLTAGLHQSLQAGALDPAIKTISGSPFSIHTDKDRPTMGRGRAHVKFHDDLSSPSRTFVDSGRPSPTASSPSAHTQLFKVAPLWRGGRESTPRKHSSPGQEDPFITNESEKYHKAGVASASLTFNPGKAGLTPTNNTAQAMFSPQACVFVANLSQSETDEQLEFSVTEAFQQFGSVYVKIRRDSRQMPFAFAQYTNIDDAQRAISLGRGMLVNGRPCRTEVARVNRSLYLSKINGSALTEAEARQILENHGPIEAIWSASATEREMFGLPEGLFIRFAFFDDCRDAIGDFRESDTYRLEQVKGLEESRSTPLRGGSTITPTYRRDSPGRFVSSPYSARRNADVRSIFVGNVPPHLSEDQLHGMFQVYGRVLHVEIIRKPSVINASGINAFAFIEFDHPHSALVAVQAGPRTYQGLHLRIEHKESTHMGSRLVHGFGDSPRRDLLENPGFLTAFQRGVSIGMSHAAQAQLMPATCYGQYPYYAPLDPASTYENLASTTSNEAVGSNNQIYQSSQAGASTQNYPYLTTTTNAAYANTYEPTPQYLPPPAIPQQYTWPSNSIYAQQNPMGFGTTHEVQ